MMSENEHKTTGKRSENSRADSCAFIRTFRLSLRGWQIAYIFVFTALAPNIEKTNSISLKSVAKVDGGSFYVPNFSRQLRRVETF